MTELKTHTLDAPGAVLHYDVRPNDASTEPPLLLVGSPMEAAGFGTLAGHFTDRTVVTYDPRGAGRSKRTDGAQQTTTEEQADDLRRLILALGGGPVDIFGSSGGAVNGLALVATHPDLVRTLVAHEPPSAQVLPDHDEVMATCAAIRATYLRAGFGPAMAKFIAMVSYAGPLPAGFAAEPGPDPASFGMPAQDDGSRDNPLLALNMVTTPGYQHDFDALRTAQSSNGGPARIVIGVGTTSAAMMAGRAGTAVAERLGTAPVTFPGGHDGFVGGEYGGMGEPDAFADTLRKVLAG
jgi:pimeloyl-ACP methyl ester carboxylesterase